ncbi:MAG: helix-turn-helix domain-containing protein [Dehalococcoidia bacterium]
MPTSRQHAKKTGLTVDDLAERSGIPAATINAWEWGEESPRLDDFERVLKAAGFVIGIKMWEDDGVDVAQIERQLRMTPEERIRTMAQAANALIAMREASIDVATGKPLHRP